jgi:Sporulation and spore germination
MTRRNLILGVLVAAVLGAGVYYLLVLRRHLTPSSANPPGAEQVARTRLSEAALQPAGGESQALTLYFPDDAQGKLIAESRSLKLAPEDVQRAKQVLLALIEGSHEGHGRTLSPSTTLRAVFLSPDGTAVIDLSQEALADFTPGIESEDLAVYSIVDSLAANVPAVKRVKFIVQGKEAQTMDGHIDITSYFTPEPALIAQTH